MFNRFLTVISNNRLLTLFAFLGVCLATALLTALGGLILGVVVSWNDPQPPPPSSDYPRISQNLEADMNQAMTPDFPFNFDTVGNPFTDKTGASLVSKQNSAAAASQLNANSAIKPSPVVAAAVAPTPVPRLMLPTLGGINPLPSQNLSPDLNNVSSADLKQRLAERERDLKMGKEVPDEASFYGIDEVRPFGIVGSGDHNRVRLFSPVTSERFSVRRGAHFRDGTIESFDAEGAQFRRDNGNMVTVRWMSNGEMPSGRKDPAAPVLNVERDSAAPSALPPSSATAPTDQPRPSTPTISPAPLPGARLPEPSNPNTPPNQF